jgi:hypothetical protein
LAGSAALVLSSGAAFASCEENNPGGVLALSGDTCFVLGSYATAIDGAILGQATGLNALITGPTEGTISFSTTGASSNALQADTGGAITLTPTAASPGTVTTTGNNSAGLYATGSAATDSGPVASSISVQNVIVTTQGSNANGVQVDNGGQATLIGGSVTTSGVGSYGVFISGSGSALQASGVIVSTTGDSEPSSNNWSHGVDVYSGGTAAFSGGSITTGGTSAIGLAVGTTGPTTSVTISNGAAILTSGDGSSGITLSGSAATVNANGITITTHGSVDDSDQFYALGAYNGSAPWASTGGVLNLTNTSITTTGQSSTGVYTGAGGQTTINGGSITTSGQNAIGLQSTGTGSSVTTTNLEEIGPITISTSGPNANGVEADNGGQVTLNGGSVTTTGAGSVGLFCRRRRLADQRDQCNSFGERPEPSVTLFSLTKAVKSP